MVCFMTGLPGTGKSTLVACFRNQTVQGWNFYDFDRGKYKIPPKDNEEIQKKQLDWWLKEVHDRDEGNAVIMGFWGFPKNLYDSSGYNLFPREDVYVGLLVSSGETIHTRMEKQGRAGKSSELTGWKAAFVESCLEYGAKMFDTEVKSVEETAEEITKWLEEITASR